MRGIRFREALAGYCSGLIIAHLRLLSVWSATAARWHDALTEGRGEVPASLASYRMPDETPLRIYAESLAGENDRLRFAVRAGVWGLARHVAQELCERAHAASLMLLQFVRGLVLTSCVVAAMLGYAAAIATVVLVLFSEVPALLASRTPAADAPDAGVPLERPIRLRPVEICVVDPPRAVLRWTVWEPSPRSVHIMEGRFYWPDLIEEPKTAADCVRLRDLGAEIYPRPEIAYRLD